jgi:hypothetical protein
MLVNASLKAPPAITVPQSVPKFARTAGGIAVPGLVVRIFVSGVLWLLTSGDLSEDFTAVDARGEVVGCLLGGAHEDSALDVIAPIAS